MKKVLLLIVFVAILCCFFCLNKAKTSDKVVLKFASWGSNSELNILKPILEDFEKNNPTIQVDFMHIPQNYFQKLHLLFASNTSPDIIFINNQYLPVYANAGVLEDISNEFDFTPYYQTSVDAMKWSGKIYAVPRDVSTMVVFYNKDLFKKYNVSLPKSGWDFEDFLATAKKITHAPNIFGVSFEEMPLFYFPYMTTCGEWIDNGDTGVNFYANLRKKYHVAPERYEIGSATMAQMFLQQRLGMQVSGRWLVPKYREEAVFDWDIAEFPSCHKGQKSVVPLDASGWAISKNCKHKKEAYRLVSYLASRESSEKFTSEGLITPARIDVSNSKIFLDNKKPHNAKVFLDVTKNAIPTPVTLDFKEKIDNLKTRAEYLFN